MLTHASGHSAHCEHKPPIDSSMPVLAITVVATLHLAEYRVVRNLLVNPQFHVGVSVLSECFYLHLDVLGDCALFLHLLLS